MTAMNEAPPYPFPALCLRWFGVLTALWLLGAGYWAYDSTQREWTRLQQMVYLSPRENYAIFYGLISYAGSDRFDFDLAHKECDDLSNQRTTGEGTPLSAALVPRLRLLLSVTLLPPTALFAIGYAILRRQRRRPSPLPE